jgi:chromosomal replication initiation ATPase DnaA
MKPPPQQLVFDLPHRSALGLEDFLVSGSNETAIELIDEAVAWPNGAALVVGPAGSGKTHLADVWRAKSQASLLRAAEASEAALQDAAAIGAVVVEDLDRGIADEAALFHLLNMSRQGRIRSLFTSRLAPGDLEILLADLRSRVRALPIAQIAPPDEALLQAVLVKLFCDRQLAVEPEVIAYLIVRMERSMAAANDIAAEIDRLGLAMRRKVTKQLAQTALTNLENRNTGP